MKFVWWFILVFDTFAFASAREQSHFDTAWYLDTHKSVKYCVLHDPQFSVGYSETEDKVQWAISKWVSYIENTGVNIDRNPLLKLSTQFEKIQNCENADLKFYFGIKTNKIVEFKERNFLHPKGFALRENYDPIKGWSKGLIWISHDFELPQEESTSAIKFSWTSTGNLKGILLHELGHVFGIGHVQGTIMDEEVYYWGGLQTTQQNINFKLTHIEHQNQLFSSKKSQLFYTGDQFYDLGIMSNENFQELTGRPPSGEIEGLWNNETSTLMFSDELAQFELQFEFYYTFEYLLENQSLFYAVRDTNFGQLSHNEVRAQNLSFGHTTLSTGETKYIFREQNLDTRHLQLYIQLQHGPVELFSQPCENQDVPFRGSICFPVWPVGEG